MANNVASLRKNLPRDYIEYARNEKHASNQYCYNCFYFEKFHCEKWHSKVKARAWCESWKQKEGVE